MKRDAPNNSMQLTALRTATDAGRYVAQKVRQEKQPVDRNESNILVKDHLYSLASGQGYAPSGMSPVLAPAKQNTGRDSQSATVLSYRADGVSSVQNRYHECGGEGIAAVKGKPQA